MKLTGYIIERSNDPHLAERLARIKWATDEILIIETDDDQQTAECSNFFTTERETKA